MEIAALVSEIAALENLSALWSRRPRPRQEVGCRPGSIGRV
jgi:hypothetical protein